MWSNYKNIRYETDGQYVPEHIMLGIQNYIRYGMYPGHFLKAVICNDFMGACCNADTEGAQNLVAIAKFFYNQAPSVCWGSQEKMNIWMEKFFNRTDEEVL